MDAKERHRRFPIMPDREKSFTQSGKDLIVMALSDRAPMQNGIYTSVDICWIEAYLCHATNPNYRSVLYGKESPDSTGRPTG